MAIVALIPTGRMEHLALPAALKAVFPDHSFVSRPPELNLNGFTSVDVATLAMGPPDRIPTNLERLARHLVNAILPGRRDEKIDFACVVEDLELCNRSQPERVLGLFRDAVHRYIGRTWPQQSDRIYGEVRERCSFHLFRPMTEAYFFGDPVALGRAGSTHETPLPVDLDLENFRTTDPEYLALPARAHDITEMPERAFHPKSYLRYLCDPTLADSKNRYRETRQGATALKALDWSAVLGPEPHCPFLHAFLDDLSEALNSPVSFVSRDHADPRVSFPGPRNRILRNL